MSRLLVLMGQKLVVQGSQLLIFRYDYFSSLLTELFAARSLVPTKVCTCFGKHSLHFWWHFHIAGSNDTTVCQMFLQCFFLQRQSCQGCTPAATFKISRLLCFNSKCFYILYNDSFRFILSMENAGKITLHTYRIFLKKDNPLADKSHTNWLGLCSY